MLFVLELVLKGERHAENSEARGIYWLRVGGVGARLRGAGYTDSVGHEDYN
jgi:hypothetical protein